MQVQSLILHDTGGCLPHDTGGVLLRLGHDATALASQAQALPAGDPRTKQLLGRARALRLQERLGCYLGYRLRRGSTLCRKTLRPWRCVGQQKQWCRGRREREFLLGGVRVQEHGL